MERDLPIQPEPGPSDFTRLGGLAALLGGILWVVALVPVQVVSPDLAGIIGIPVVLLMVGSVALEARQAGRTGRLGRLGLRTTLVGSLLLMLGGIAELGVSGKVLGIEFGPIVLGGQGLGTVVLGIGAALVALAAIATNALPRLSPVPLLAGGLGIAFSGGLVLADQILDAGPPDLFPFGFGASIPLWVLFGIGWLWLGYLLWSERILDVSWQ